MAPDALPDPESSTVTPSSTTLSLLVADEAMRRAALDAAIIDVSHTEGVPIGTLGSGFSLFGRHGFQRATFDGPPAPGPGFTEPADPAPFGFEIVEGEDRVALAEHFADDPAHAEGRRHCERVFAYALLPKAYFRFEASGLELGVVMTAFSGLLPHDLASASVPAQVFELTLENRGKSRRTCEARLASVVAGAVREDALALAWRGGEVGLAAPGGAASKNAVCHRVTLAPGETKSVRFLVAWYCPEFRTPSPCATATYRRDYARRFAGVHAVLAHARHHADAWSAGIDAWHASYGVPSAMKRLWFSSLSSVVSCTLLSDDPYFFAVESPHEWVNTMDVAVYANWVYLVNWPELERLDLDMYRDAIATDGEQVGFVWHSLWTDAAHYAEEPTYVERLFRAHLWFNDRDWLASSFDHAVAAANTAYRRNAFEGLLVSERGNQSYDEWMMPGASAYVNVAWRYALHALERMATTLGRPASVGEMSVAELGAKVSASLVERLFTEQGGSHFRCFFRTPGASDASLSDTIFTDQLFGRWVLAIDPSSIGVLPEASIARTLTTIYENNERTDAPSGFRGWVNGMLPGQKVDRVSGYHARTFWLGAQLDLASLLGTTGDELRSLAVFESVEKSLGSNHLAVGEWNRAVDADGRVVLLETWGKDTPRFPPYPRYTSSWEYLIRMLGLTLDERFIHLRPFRALCFTLDGVDLAGTRLRVRVERGWSHALVGGAPVSGAVALERGAEAPRVEFLR